MQVPTVAWPGGSGKTYTFDLHPISVTVNPGYSGNYIFTKKEGNKWLAVYIGEGDLKGRTTAHLSEGQIIKKGATHLCLRVNNNEKQRFDDETDLLAGNIEAYEPIGCNVKKGG